MGTSVIRALLIDDEPSLLEISKQFLEFDHSISVDTAISATDAQKLIVRREYDVIISDYHMPGKDGIQLLKEIRTAGNRVPFIIFTGKGREEVAIEALNAGADFYLQKGGQSASQFAELANMIKQAYSRKEGEWKLRISEERYRSLFANSVDAVMLTTNDFESILSANPSACKMFGMTEDEIRKFGVKNLIIDDKAWESVLRRLNQTGIAKGEFTYKRKDGTTFTGETTSGILTGHYGIARISMIVRDITERKLAGEVIRESEARLWTYMDNAPEGVFIVDRFGDYQDVNKTACSMLGYSQEELLKLNFADIVEKSVLQDSLKKFQQLLENGAMAQETILVKKDGTNLPVYLNAVELPNKEFMAFCTDITERNQAEGALRESEERYRNLYEGVPIGYQSLDAKGEIITVNDAWLKTLGYHREEVIGRPFEDLLTPGYKTKYIECFSKFKREGAVLDVELQMVRKDGSEILVSFNGKISYDEKGEVNQTHCVFIDITERKQAEERNQLLASALEQVNNAVVFVNKDDDVLYWNKMAENLYQWKAGEAIGKKINELVVPYISSDQAHRIMRTVRDTGRWEGEFRVRRKDGSLFDAYVSDTLIKDAQGNRIGMVGISNDVTMRKRAEVALQVVNKKLNLLSSITRHDIKNQLMVLDGNLTLMAKRHLAPASKELLRKSESAVDRISAMIDFTKEYENVGVQAPIWQNVRSLIEEEAKNVVLGPIKLGNDVPIGIEVYADPLTAKMFHNLIDNAMRHGVKVTSLHFFMEEIDGDRAIICEDDGIGISSDMKKELFTQGSGKSHGFGLFLSSEILSITGISIEENGEPGKGAKFVIKVPAEGLRTTNEKRISN